MDFLNFNSVETLPGFETHAAFTVNSSSVFKEDVDIVPTIVDNSLSYIPWGGDNQMPFDLLALVEKDETPATCQWFNAEVCYGSGPQYCATEASAAVKSAVEDFTLDNDLAPTSSAFRRSSLGQASRLLRGQALWLRRVSAYSQRERFFRVTSVGNREAVCTPGIPKRPKSLRLLLLIFDSSYFFVILHISFEAIQNMDLNSWNEQAHKADEIASRHNRHLSSLKKKIDGSSFICPWCGKQHNISEANIIKIVASNDLIAKGHSFNATTKTYVKTSYRVRFCKKCFSKNERNKKIFFTIGKVIYAILGFYLLYWMFTTDEKLSFSSCLGFIVMYGMIALVAIGLKDKITENFFDIANIEEAYKNNAIG